MSAGIPLGLFDILEPLGRGGMGQVWRARHRAQQTPAAIKVLTGTAATEPNTLKRFRDEVRAVAALDHPGVVMVLDDGVVDTVAAEASGGELVAGSPYLVMELATGGSLQDIRAPLPWSTLRRVLLALLDALAHAHARGVIHRDLKPGNVLVCTSEDERPGLKLSDFGIATAIDGLARPGSLKTVAGTLHYIAPEQLLGNWRDAGPWTDLYALGCMAYRITAGHLPFTGKRGADLMRAQLFERPPPLCPRLPVPDGFEDWVRRLMAKPIGRRFQRAADAAWALEQLRAPAAPEPDTPHPLPREQPLSPAAVAEVTTLMLQPPSLAQAISPGPDPLPKVGPPPMPQTWRRPTPAPPPLQLQGAGLGLFGLRRPRMVGRIHERDLIWQALNTVHSGGVAARVIHGPQGTGKRRLVSWICERAHEMGAAIVLRAACANATPATEPLRRMVQRALRTAGLSRQEVEERVTDWLRRFGVRDPVFLADLSDLLVPDRHRATTRVHSAEDRYTVLTELFTSLSRERPVLLLLEDVQDCTDALGLIAHLLRCPGEARVLVLATVQDEELADTIRASARLERVEQHPNVARIDLEPLRPTEHTTLIRGLLKMDSMLAAQVEEKTRGNPLFAVRLLAHWIDRGLLALGPTGFRLDASLDTPLPADVRHAWDTRVAKLVEGLHPDAQAWLERAAILDLVEPSEWSEVCGPQAAPVLTLLVDLMQRARLLRAHGSHWSYAHPMMQESLLHSARAARRWREHHRACLTMLRARPDQPGRAERIGRHLAELGEVHAAMPLLLTGIRERRLRLGHRPALALLGTTERAMATHGVDPTDPRWGELWVLRGELLAEQLELQTALDWLDRAATWAHRHHWQEIFPAAHYHQVLIYASMPKVEFATRHAQTLRDWAQVWQREDWLGPSHFGAAEAAIAARNFDLARSELAASARIFVDRGDELGLADCWRVHASHSELADDTEADELFGRAMAIYARHGRVALQATCRNGMAEMARARGDLEEAERGYHEALAAYESVGHSPVLPTLNLALVCLKRGRFLEARRAAERANLALQDGGRQVWRAAALAALLACTGAMQDWTSWDHYLRRVQAVLHQDALLDPDLAWLLQLAGRLATQSRAWSRATTAYSLALDQWTGLEEADRIREVKVALDDAP